MTVSSEERYKAKTTRIGSDKLCPIQSIGSAWEIPAHCYDKCEWNDGEGCAIWRIVKALEKMDFRAVQLLSSFLGGDSK